jgi:hypothetical protein
MTFKDTDGGFAKSPKAKRSTNTKSLPPAWLMEKLAAIEHERWADWQKWCHQVLRQNLPVEVIKEVDDLVLARWERQIDTPYEALSEAEKQSDRDQVMRYWPLIQQWITESLDEAFSRTADHYNLEISKETN